MTEICQINLTRNWLKEASILNPAYQQPGVKTLQYHYARWNFYNLGFLNYWKKRGLTGPFQFDSLDISDQNQQNSCLSGWSQTTHHTFTLQIDSKKCSMGQQAKIKYATSPSWFHQEIWSSLSILHWKSLIIQSMMGCYTMLCYLGATF